MTRWGDERTLLFITYYKECECLWNQASPLYKKKSARRNAYMSLLHQMYDDNLTIDAVKVKIKNLRTTYHQELKKIEESKRSGDPSQVYKPSVVWFEALHSFLDERINGPVKLVEVPQQAAPPAETSQTKILPKTTDMPVILRPNTSQSKTTATVKNMKLILTSQNTKNYKEGTGLTPTEQVKNLLLNIPPQQTNNNLEGAVMNQNHQVNHTPSHAKKRLLDTDESVTNKIQKDPPWAAKKRLIETTEPELSGVLERLEDISVLVNAPKEDDDEFHYFGMNIAAQLRRLPLNVALQMQAEFQNSLYLARVRSQNGGTSTTVSVAEISPLNNEYPIETYIENVKEEEEELPQIDIKKRIEFESDLSDESEIKSELED